MIRVILAILGILCICTGGYAAYEDVIMFGILLILPGVITILVKIIKAINEKNRENIWRDLSKFDETTKKQQVLAAQQQALAEQRRLLELFRNSPLTQEVINTICNKNPSVHLPERIEIFNNCIRANLHGQSLAYDFASHRVYPFQSVIITVSNHDDLRYIVKPQMAMAEAINTLLGYKYEIRDQATERYNEHEDYSSITYLSNSVVLILKSTLPNRNF